ncbi:hypothetical protein B0A50_02022 [Salinomyces thailandicus]|uniref:Rhodopsin domain-containing protein n=1 Tax=Salinomyces thailandicus TaxID=706561 RepID=A0A4U0U7N0_9PEZI|nr:hypothetical protein B0A50_02022 [Salinomyces thailandica]
MATTGDFGPAPEGMDLTATQVPSIYASIIITAVLGTLSVLARFYARILLRNPIGADDWLIVAALIWTWGTSIAAFVAIPHGMGKHMYALTFAQFNNLWQNLFAYVNIYVIAVSFTKLSIVLFYKRVFQFEKLYWCLLAAVLMYPFTVIIVIFNALPIPLVWRLQMPKRQRVAVLGIFMLASFVVIASVVRIVMLEKNTQSHDPVWTIAPVYIWSSVEPFVGIICACLPTLSPLFRRYWGGRKSQAISSTGRMTPGASNTIDTISGSKNKYQRRFQSRLRPDDEVMLTSVYQTHAGLGSGNAASGDAGSEDNVAQIEHIHVRKEFDIDWSNQPGVEE